MSQRQSDEPGLDPATLELCRALEEELAAPIEPIAIPEAQDRALRAAAADRAELIAAPRRRRRRWLVGGLVACAAAAAIFVASRGLIDDRDRGEPVAIAGDINRDGALDVIDALALARALDGDAAPSMAWDLTGDGAVDRADVDWIAERVVRLAPEEIE